MASPDIVAWDADFLVYTAKNGRKYRVELTETLEFSTETFLPYAQIALGTGTRRVVYRQPAPSDPEVLPCVRELLPGASWAFEAGWRGKHGSLASIKKRPEEDWVFH